MKNLGLIIIATCLFFFTACEKQNCRDGVLGTYSGTYQTQSFTIKLNVGSSDKDVLVGIAAPASYAGERILTGTLNADCSIVSIPDQTVAGSVHSGSMTINGSTINGTIYVAGFPSVLVATK